MVNLKRISRITLILILSCMLLMLSGCKEIQIFKKKVDKNKLTPVKNTELVQDLFYVKNGTDFNAVFLPTDGTGQNFTTVLDERRSFMVYDRENCIPPHYIHEIIGCASKNREIPSITLERYKYLGYSLGVFKAELDKDGYISFSAKDNTVKGSSAGNLFRSAPSDQISIVSIDGEFITDENFNKSTGIITGLEQFATVTVGYYAGSYYNEEELVADSMGFQAYEMFNYSGDKYTEDTPHGYKAFNTPDDLKSGFYNINGTGLFKYYAYARGEGNDAEEDMNVSYYKSDRERLEAYSQQYVSEVKKRSADVTFKVTFDSSTIAEDTALIQGYVYGPDDSHYKMSVDLEEQTMQLDLTEAMPGVWQMNIVPMTLNVTDVQAISNDIPQELNVKETHLSLEEGEEQWYLKIPFYSVDAKETGDYETVEKDVSAIVIDPDGETHTFDKEEEDKKWYLVYRFPYAKAGSYNVRVSYHEQLTEVEDVEVGNYTDTVQIIEVDEEGSSSDNED